MFTKTLRRNLWGFLPIALSSICGLASAQTPAALATPNLALYTNGTVYTSARMDDGGIVFAGRFSQVKGLARSNIARLKPDGTLDLNWNPGTDYSVKALVNDNKGHIYVGGNFQTVGGLSLYHIARFSSIGAGNIDAEWNANLPCVNVHSLTANSAGDVFVGGYNCQTSAGATDIVKLSGDTGALNSTWSILVNGEVTAITVDANDNLYLGGLFGKVGGQTRRYLAKVSSLDGGQLDPTWNPAPANTEGTVRIYSLSLDSQGNLIVGGSFTSIGGQNRNNIARVSTTGIGNADPIWNPSSDGKVNAVAVDGSGHIYAGGTFTSIGGQSGAALARLSATGTGSADTSWPAAGKNISGNMINSLTVNGNGDVYVGGFFSMLGGQERHSFAAIRASGNFGPSTDVTAPGGVVNAITRQPDGGLIVAGYFSGSGSFVRSNVLRLQRDGSIDPNWSASTDAPNYMGVEAVAVATDGSIYLGGEFSHVNGKAQSGIAKLSSTGALDPAWNSPSDATNISYYGVRALGLANDGSVYVGGDFSTIGAVSRNYLAKISSGGLVDPIWNPIGDATGNPDLPDGVTAIAVDTDGTIYIASDAFGLGSSAQRIFKVSGQGNGAIDPTWAPTANIPYAIEMPYALLLDGKGNLYAGGIGLAKLSTKNGATDLAWRPRPFGNILPTILSSLQPPPRIYALALDGNGSLYAGGAFSDIFQTALDSNNNESVLDQRSRPFLAKLSADGAAQIDPAWNPNPDNAVYALATDPSGLLYAGGSFSQIGTQPRGGFATLPQGRSANPIVPDNLDQFGWTGAWYNPATSGQGILLQIIPSTDPMKSGTFFGAWFTYDLYGEGGGQRWYTFQGPVDGTSKTVTPAIYATSYFSQLQRFIPNYAGNAIFTFEDCMHASVAYALVDPPVYSSGGALGSFPLVRLGANNSCTPNGDAAYGGDYSLSGMWYDPTYQYSGMVFLVDPISRTFFASWFLNSYSAPVNTPDGTLGSKAWYTLQSTYLAGTTSMENIPIYSTQGGALDYPSPITNSVVGTANLVFNNCNSVTLTYTFTGGSNSGTKGTLNLTRGVGKPVSCNP